MTKTLPIVGAAMTVEWLDTYRDWLIADQRDLEIQDFANPYILDGDWQSVVEEAKSKLDGYEGRLGIHAPFYNLPLAAIDAKIREIVIQRHVHSLDIAGELGATHMVIHSPLAFLGMPSSLTQPMMGPVPLFQVIHETMEPIVERAAAVNCTLVIETIFDQLPQLWVDLAKSFDSKFVRLSVDVGHAYINHFRGAAPPDYWVQEAGSLLGHLHLQDTDGYTDRHWSLGQGKVDWHSVFAAVARLEHKPRLILELNNHADIPASAAWLADNGLAR